MVIFGVEEEVYRALVARVIRLWMSEGEGPTCSQMSLLSRIRTSIFARYSTEESCQVLCQSSMKCTICRNSV